MSIKAKDLSPAQTRALSVIFRQVKLEGVGARVPYGEGTHVTMSTATALKRLGIVELHSQHTSRPAKAGFGAPANWKTVYIPNRWMTVTSKYADLWQRKGLIPTDGTRVNPGLKLTPKQAAMAPRALAFIRDDFERQDAAEVQHWGKHLHAGSGVSNIAVGEHLGMGKKDTWSLLSKLVAAGLLRVASTHTETGEQRRGWAGGGARNFHKEHWNYTQVSYTVERYRITPEGEAWLAAQVRSNPAPMEVQSILFDRELWTPRRAEAWLRRHDYVGLDLDEKPNTYRYRQHDPDLFRPRSFRTIAFGEETGIQAVVGKRKRGARVNPKAPSAPRISPENEFISLFRVRDAFAGRETLSKDIIEEVAWELGYEREPYAKIERFEGMAAGFGADLRRAHARGAAEAPRRNPVNMRTLRTRLRRRIRALTPQEARDLVQSWIKSPDAGAAKIAWVSGICGGWTQSLMGVLAVELPKRMVRGPV